jgi:molybdopterin-guanine dinucleotide biosynthesis protein A
MMSNMSGRITCGGKPMTAIVLAGGRGRRMKADKAGLDVGGRTLLEHVLAQVEPLVDEVLVSVSPGQSPELPPRSDGWAPMRLVADELPDRGPIGGVLAGLKAARNDACLVVACDIPEIDLDLVRELTRTACWSEITVPVGPSGLHEPLFAVYRKSVVPAIEALLAAGVRSLLPLFDRCRTAVVQFEDPGRIRNLNTREDYEAYLRGPGKK